MLSDADIEKLLARVINRQEKLNTYIIQKIAERVREIGNLLPSEVHTLEQILKSGTDIKEIEDKIAELTKLNVHDIEQIFIYVANDAYRDKKPYYDYRQTPYVSFLENDNIQNIIKTITALAVLQYLDSIGSLVFMMFTSKSSNTPQPMSVKTTYNTVVNCAIQALSSGLDYKTITARLLQQLADSSLRTLLSETNDVFYTTQMTVELKRQLLNYIRDLNQQIQDELGRQLGADGKEISVHEMSAPDHEPIQGHQFTDAEYEKLQNEQDFEDVNGSKFSAITRAIGTWNCRHFTYSIIVGFSKPRFTQEELDKNIERNQAGYTNSRGRHRTLYECTQEQRRLERQIRSAKHTIIAGRASSNDILLDRGRANLAKYTKQYSSFSRACGIPTEPNNCYVEGY